MYLKPPGCQAIIRKHFISKFTQAPNYWRRLRRSSVLFSSLDVSLKEQVMAEFKYNIVYTVLKLLTRDLLSIKHVKEGVPSKAYLASDNFIGNKRALQGTAGLLLYTSSLW